MGSSAIGLKRKKGSSSPTKAAPNHQVVQQNNVKVLKWSIIYTVGSIFVVMKFAKAKRTRILEGALPLPLPHFPICELETGPQEALSYSLNTIEDDRNAFP